MSVLRVYSSPSDAATLKSSRAVSSETSQRACWGFLSKRERWGLSVRGCLVVIAIAIFTGVFGLLAVYPFLAVTERTSTELLAVEGWVGDYAIRAATEEFTAGGYRQVFTTGGPVRGIGGYRNDYSTAASIGANRLRDAGVPATSVQMVPSRTSDRDRTYSSALALRDWLKAQHLTIRSINVLTENVHARRTRLLFQRAFGDSVTVGIVAVPTPDYDAKHWWRYSEGVREVLGETIAYGYAKFLFFPAVVSTAEPTRPLGRS